MHINSSMSMDKPEEHSKNHHPSDQSFPRSVESACFGVWDWNIETGELVWSPECLEMFGLSLDTQMTYERFMEAIAPEDRQKVDQAVKVALETGNHYSTEMRAVWPDGSLHWIASRGRAYYNEAGKPIRMSGAGFDITAVKQTEDELRRARAEARSYADNLATVVDAIPAITFFSVDREGRTMTAGRAAREVFGLPENTNVSLSDPAVRERFNFQWLEDGRLLAPEELPVQQAASTGKPVGGRKFEVRFPDGKSIHLLGHAVPLLDAAGQPHGAVGAFLDVTDMQRKESELREARAEAKAQADNLAAVLEAMPAAAFISYDRKCEKIIANKAAYELLRMPNGGNPSLTAPEHELPDFVPFENGREIPGEELPLQIAAATGRAVHGKEIEIRFPDGSSIFEYGHSVPLFDEAGKVRGAVGAYLDVTDMKVMEQRLRGANERFQVALRNTPITVFNQDLELRYKWIYNPPLGLGVADFIGKSDGDLFSPTDAERMQSIKGDVIRTGRSYQGEVEVGHGTEARTYHVTLEAQRDAQNNICGLMGASFDLTENKQQAAELEKLAKQRKLALDAVHMGWWHYNPATKLGSWDETFRDTFGLQKLSGPSDDVLKLIHPDDRLRVRTALGDALNPADRKANITEFRIIRPDGRELWLEAYGAAEFAGEGKSRTAISASGTVRDITDRKEIEEKLRLTTERFEAALRGTPMTVFNQDKELRFTWVYNPVGLHDGPQIIGKTDADLLEPQDAAWSMEIKREVLRTGKPYQGEFSVMMAGRRRYYHVNIDPQRDGKGEIVGLTCSSFDITDLRGAQAEIEKLAHQRQMALDFAKMGWWRYDAVTGASVWDHTFKQMFGLATNSGNPEVVAGLLHPDDRDAARTKFRAAVAGTAPYMNEYRVPQPDGSMRWIESHGAAEFEGVGAARRVVAVSGTVQDITDRRIADARRNQTQEAFATLVQNAPYGVYVVDSEFRLALTDPGSRTEAFRNVDPLDGRDFGEIMRILWPEPLASQIITIFHHTLDTGEPYYSERFRNLRRDLGDVKAYEWETHRIVLPDGKYGVVCFYFDSTEMRDKEDALWRQRERAEFVAEGSDVGFWYCDLPFDRLAWDKRVRNHFWLPDDDSTITIAMFYAMLHPDDREPTRRAIEASIAKNQQYDVEYRTMAPDGRHKWIRATGRTFYDASGKPVRFDGITQDITTRKQVEEALKGSEARYRELAASLEQQVQLRTQELEQRNEDLLRASEELRIMSGRLLQVQDEERRRIARDLHDSSGQILTAIGLDLANIAEHAKSEKIRTIAPQLLGQVEGSQKLVDLLHRELRTTTYLLHPPLLDEAGLSSAINWYMQGMTQRSGMEIEFDFAQDFGRLPREMELLVFRLVQESMTNIHRHSGSKTASIRIKRLAEAITVDIEDRGRGIPPDKLAEIQAGVSGLGIRAMRERLRQFGGDLRIESNGGGTRVFVVVPLQQASEDSGGVEPVEAAI